MQWRPFAVLFSIALFVLALPLAATAQAAPTTLTTDATDTATLPDGTISDTATLNAPDSTNGSIEFRLYGPFTTAPTATDCTAAKLIAGAGSTVPVTDHTA